MVASNIRFKKKRKEDQRKEERERKRVGREMKDDNGKGSCERRNSKLR